jgi:signal transduction histidine kinase
MSGLAGYFRDRPIWVKLGLLVLIPTIATISVGFSALLSSIGATGNANQAHTLAELTTDAGTLVQALQNERAAATMLLTAPKPEQDSDLVKYKALFAATTQAAQSYAQRRNTLSGLPGGYQINLAAIADGLRSLDGLRQQVASIDTTKLKEAIDQYGFIISDLVLLRDASAQLSGDANLSFDMRAGAALANIKEQLSQERVTVLQILRGRAVTPQLQADFLTERAGQQISQREFSTVATPAQYDLFHKTFTGPNVDALQRIEQAITVQQPGVGLPQGIPGVDQWEQVVVGDDNLLRQVESAVDRGNLADANALHSRVQRQVLAGVGLLLVLILVVLVVAWMVARSMNRSLSELRHGALAIAHHGLPQAVARLRDPALSTQMSPQQVAHQIAEPLPIRSRDEFGQVTEAFNAVHLEAVRTAAEQAQLRASVSTMFVNLARRSQILVDRLIGHLDRLERGEEDPDRLAELFQLDHLATRMRRNDENLLVLAGADSTRVQREPAALIDVLRAAQSEVEHYTRIEFGVIDRDIEVGSHAVNDLVHLVAELFDNATAFSPPDSSVIVEARRVGDRAVLYVEDHGIGMSSEQLAELNERLATPPQVDVAVSRMMGLVVVARLADRHGVKVELRPAADRGTIADVLLPTTALIPRALAGRGVPLLREQMAPPVPRSGEPVPPRSPFATPLALESGPSAGQMAGSGAPTGPSTGGFGGFGAVPGPPPGLVNGAVPGAPVSGVPAGRQLPAWSDLTGAANGVNGVDPYPAQGRGGPSGPTALDRGFGGPGPDRQVPNTPGGAGPERFGAPSGPGPERFGRGPTGPGGPGGVAGVDRFAPGFVPGAPLPQRPRGTDPETVEGEVTGEARPSIPRQMSSSPEARTVEPVAPGAERDAVDADVVEDDRVFVAPSAPTPPAWPPVPAADTEDQAEAAPPLPEDLASALDITSEMPKVHVDDEPAQAPAQPASAGWNTPSGASKPVPEAYGAVPVVPAAYNPPPLVTPQPTASPAVPASAPPAAEPARLGAFPDETMELPIFRELESAWFRGRGSTVTAPDPAFAAPGAPEASWPTNGDSVPAAQPVSAAPSGTAPAPAAAVSWPSPAAPPAGNMAAPASAGPRDNGQMGSSQMPGGRTDMPEPVWRSAADEGWLAANAASQPEVAGVTDAGLPKRVPMAQLVPGGVEKNAANANRRSPEQVRGLLSAYHRGVQRGRGRGDEDRGPESSTTTGHSPHGGKEQDA